MSGQRDVAGSAVTAGPSHRWAVRFLVVPSGLVFVGTVVVLALALLGYHPFWPVMELSMAEAAALGDAGVVLMRISEGADPNLPRPVAAGIIGDRALELTPLEAAIAGGQVATLDLLLRHGVVVDDAARARLACLALLADQTELLEPLRAAQPDMTAGDCADVTVPW